MHSAPAEPGPPSPFDDRVEVVLERLVGQMTVRIEHRLPRPVIGLELRGSGIRVVDAQQHRLTVRIGRARIMPFDSTPINLAFSRLATITTERPTKVSGA